MTTKHKTRTYCPVGYVGTFRGTQQVVLKSGTEDIYINGYDEEEREWIGEEYWAVVRPATEAETEAWAVVAQKNADDLAEIRRRGNRHN